MFSNKTPELKYLSTEKFKEFFKYFCIPSVDVSLIMTPSTYSEISVLYKSDRFLLIIRSQSRYITLSYLCNISGIKIL